MIAAAEPTFDLASYESLGRDVLTERIQKARADRNVCPTVARNAAQDVSVSQVRESLPTNSILLSSDTPCSAEKMGAEHHSKLIRQAVSFFRTEIASTGQTLKQFPQRMH